ncbi:MAG: zinc ribbon domain-containing protein [Dehalococcoidales bacterium]|nr:zinc ribbon domain-containing protein [Dehalococcoidales bacterium]
MPIYVYECPCCSSRFELRQSFSDKAKGTCPQCGEDATRIFWPAPIIFKGSGFYVTDYRNDRGHASGNGNGDAKVGSKTEDA